MDEIKSGQVPFPDPAGNQKPVPVIYFKDMNKAIAMLKDGLELKDRFTTKIAQILAHIYGNENGDYYNPQEAKKYQKIAEESQGLGNVRFTITPA